VALYPYHAISLWLNDDCEGRQSRLYLRYAHQIADISLRHRPGPERNWRDIARVADELRDRRVGGKAVFGVAP
jgi:hypothetical protein